jgi:hypothetical protein
MGLYNTKLFLPPPLLPSPRPLCQSKQKTKEIIKIKKLRDGILAAYCCLSCAFMEEGKTAKLYRERKSFGILITYKRLMQHEVMKPKNR